MTQIWLSKMVLNGRHPLVRGDLADRYSLHKRIAELVGPTPVPARGARPLYRVELPLVGNQARDQRVVLLQTQAVPNWSQLPDGYLVGRSDDLGFGVHHQVASKRIDPALATLRSGLVLQFKLMAWPNNMVGGSRQLIDRYPSLIAWLTLQGDRRGFQLVTERKHPDVAVTFQEMPIKREEVGKPISWPNRATVFEGRLRVCDPDALRETVARGIGDGKAYGLGLLSLIRPA